MRKLYTSIKGSLAILCCLVSVNCFGGNVNTQAASPAKLPYQLQSMVSGDMVMEDLGQGIWRSHPRNKAPETTAETVSVTTTSPDGSTTFVFPNGVLFFNKDFVNYDGSNMRMASEATFEIPKGTYDVIMSYYDYMDFKNVLVVRENVTLENDTTMAFDPAEATVHLKFRGQSPDGEMWTMDHYDSNYNYVEGNILQICFGSSLHVIDSYDGHDMQLGGSYTVSASQLGSDYNNNTDFFINPVSDRYVFTQLRTIIDKDYNFYINSMKLVGVSTDSICALGENYKPYSETIKVVPTNSDQWRAGHQCYGIYNGIFDLGTSGRNGWQPIEADQPITFYIDAEQDTSNEDCVFDVTTGWTKSNPVLTGYDMYGDPVYEYYPTSTPAAVISNGHRYYRFLGPYSYQGLFTFNASAPQLDWSTGYALYSFDEDQKKGTFGDCTPVMRLESRYDGIVNPPLNSYTLDVSYYGRLGEVIDNNLYTMAVDLTVNDVAFPEIDTYALLNEFIERWNFLSERDKAKFEIKMTSTNGTVDDLESRNVTEIVLDENNDDAVPPTLTMLQFRDNLNNVTDRFDTKDDANVFLTVADYTIDWTDAEAVLQNAQVTVAYAPTGSSDFKDLAVDRLEDLTIAQMGYAYTGKLANVDVTSPTGWYDMLITVTDDAGNYQRQLVSPAFRLDDMASVTSIQASSEQGPVDVYDLSGRIVRKAASSIDGLAKGLYLVKDLSTGISMKITVK